MSREDYRRGKIMRALDQARLNLEFAQKLATEAAAAQQQGGECVGPITLHLRLLRTLTDFLNLPKDQI